MDPAFLICYFIVGLLSFFVLLGGIHKVQEGHIGVYTRGGALLEKPSAPGINFMFPILTKFHGVQVTLQTDKVTDIPCGTSGGVLVYFDKIEVVNRLKKELAYDTVKNYTIDYDKTWIFDKIHHEINQFCSSRTLQEVYITKFDQLDENLRSALQTGANQWAPGIEIIAVRVTKPRIPENIQQNYEKMEAEKAALLTAKESQKVKEKEAESDKLIEMIKAETIASVSTITMQKEILMKDGTNRIQAIENDISYEKKKGYAEAENYKSLKEIEINNKKLTEDYIRYNTLQLLKEVPKFYFGKSFPDYLAENIYVIPELTRKEAAKSAK
jgi:regulator of protease activity HflC (stomatin/prohibitin superfamily)